jgi:hypothetical protein
MNILKHGMYLVLIIVSIFLEKSYNEELKYIIAV